MSCTTGNNGNINETFIIEPLSITGGSPTLSACTSLFTNEIISCSGNTRILMGTNTISFSGNLYTDYNISANTINALTYLSGGTNLLDIFTANTYVTGGTLSGDTLELFRNDNVQININLSDLRFSGGSADCITDFYVTNIYGCSPITIHDHLIVLSGITLNLPVNDDTLTQVIVRDSISGDLKYRNVQSILSGVTGDTFVTGGTPNDSAHTYTFTNNSGGTFTVYGLADITITGGTYSAGTVTFINSTGGTFTITGLSSTDTYTTGFTYGNNVFTIKQNQGQPDLSVLFNTVSGLTINGNLTVTGNTTVNNLSVSALTATTISATTYLNLPIDVRVTGGTYSNGTAIFRNNTGGTFNVSGFVSGDTYVTGGTTSRVLNNTTLLFTNNTGGTFTVTGITDVFVTGITINNATYDLTVGRNDGVNLTTNLGILATDIKVTGGTYNINTGVVTFTNSTGGTFSVSGFTSGMTDTTISSFTYNNANRFTIVDSTGGTFNASFNVVTGLTVNGNLTVTGNTSLQGLTATTISATTYFNLPIDIRVTGGTPNNTAHTYTFTNNTGGTFNVIGLADVFVTGGTYNPTTGIETFTNNTGGTFNVSGFFTGSTEVFVTGGTANRIANNTTLIFTNNTGGTFSVTGITDTFVTGGTYSAGTITITNNSGNTFNITGLTNSDTFVTAFTYNNNVFTIKQNQGQPDLSVLMNTVSGLTVNGNLTVTGNTTVNVLSATTISATTFFGNGSNITGLPFVTGGTFNNSTDTITFTNSTGGTFNVTGLTDNFTTGTTLIGNTAYFNRNDTLSAYTLDLSSFSGDANTFVTGGTFNNNTDTLTLVRNDNVNVLITGFTDFYTTGGTLVGSTIYFNRNDSLSAYTVDLSSIDVNDTFVTGGTYSAGTAVFTNNTGGTFSVTGFNTTIDTYVTGGTVSRTGNNTTLIFTNSTGGTFNVSSIVDTFVTGGTYNNGTTIFTNNSGNTFSVTGFNTTIDTYVTGGTFNNNTDTITFTNSTGGTFNVTGLTDNFTTGATLVGSTAYFNRNDTLSAYTLDLSSFSGDANTFVTGGTFNNVTDTLTLVRNDNGNVLITGFTDFYTTGATLINSTIYFNRNDVLSAYTVDLSSLDVNDTFVTGGTPDNTNHLYTFTNNTGGTFNVIGLTDVFVTGGTYNPTTGVETFTNNTGGTFTVSGFFTGATDVFVTGGTANNSTHQYTFTNNTGGTFNVIGLTDVFVTGATYSAGTATFTNNTGGTFSVTGINSTDTYTTGFTYGNNVLTIQQNQGQPDLSVLINTMTGLTINGNFSVTGNTNLQALTATTISATTYLGLPIDVRVTGGTYSNGVAIFSNNTGGTFNVNGFFTGATDVFVTGGTLSTGGTATFINNTGGTFNISGFTTSSTDVYSTGMTLNLSNYDLTITRNDGNSFFTNLGALASDVTITGGTYNINTGVVTFTNNTGGTFNVSGFTSGMTDTTISSFTYNNANTFTIVDSTGGTFNASFNVVTGLTVNGDLTITGNTSLQALTATTISATTYFNLPIDIRVTGGTYNPTTGIETFTNNTGGTFTVSGFFTGSTDIFVTGGTPNDSAHIYTFTNNTGGTFTVVGLTDVRVTGGTFSAGTINFTNNTGGTFSVTGLSSSDTYTTAYTYNNNVFTIKQNQGQPDLNVLMNTLTGLTINGDLTITGNTSLQALTATTISATTYFNLPLDIRVTGGTYSNGTAVYTNNTGGTFNVSGFFTGATDVFVTGGTVNRINNNTTLIFTNSTGGTFNVSTIVDTFVTGGTYVSSANTITFTNNSGNTFNVTGLTSSSSADTYTTAYTYNNNVFTIKQNQGQPNLTALINTMTGLTINGNLTVTGATTSGSLSATTISSTTLTVSGVTFNRLLIEKVGSVGGASFTGNPKVYSVVFATNFADTNYGIFLTGTENRTYTYESQTVSGFTINARANAALAGNVYWMAKQIGEV